MAYCPPGWFMAEKVVNYRCAFGLRVCFLPDFEKMKEAALNMAAVCEMGGSGNGLAGYYKQKVEKSSPVTPPVTPLTQPVEKVVGADSSEPVTHAAEKVDGAERIEASGKEGDAPMGDPSA
eukprot:3366222-Amphidinium_carterae.1